MLYLWAAIGNQTSGDSIGHFLMMPLSSESHHNVLRTLSVILTESLQNYL